MNADRFSEEKEEEEEEGEDKEEEDEEGKRRRRRRRRRRCNVGGVLVFNTPLAMLGSASRSFSLRRPSPSDSSWNRILMKIREEEVVASSVSCR